MRSLQIVNRYLKREAARLESQGDGAFTSEALFASNVKAKRPEILAAGARYNYKKAPSHRALFL
ncbi:hypothetical protein DY471_26215 [Bacillus anthracis]|nr:hypothetical protein DY471_26215 [Bacillus anthracis]